MTNQSSILDGSLILIVMRDDETDHYRLGCPGVPEKKKEEA